MAKTSVRPRSLNARLGGGIGDRALVREALFFSAPAALTLLLLVAANQLGLATAFAGWLLSLAASWTLLPHGSRPYPANRRKRRPVMERACSLGGCSAR